MRSLLIGAALGAVMLAGCRDARPPTEAQRFADNALSQSKVESCDDYIVQLRKDAGPSGAWAKAHGVSPKFAYLRALNGFAGMLCGAAATALEKNPAVEHVTRSQHVTVAQVPWHKDRIDQRSLPTNGVYASDRTGAGVKVYIVDTGIRSTHVDFGGRVSGGVDLVGDGLGTEDCHGHGTHVAGAVGGATYGTATAASLVPVRVFSCAGAAENSVVIAALDWIIANGVRPGVVSMAMEGPRDSVLNTAVWNTLAAGFTVVAAAGNGATDACTISPASVGGALTIGATSVNDAKPGFSNNGPCVDLYAPGIEIVSDWFTRDAATAVQQGTSQASALAAGVAALYLQGAPTATAQQVHDALKSFATKRAAWATFSTSCDLLYSGRTAQNGSGGKCK